MRCIAFVIGYIYALSCSSWWSTTEMVSRQMYTIRVSFFHLYAFWGHHMIGQVTVGKSNANGYNLSTSGPNWSASDFLHCDEI